MQQCAKRVTMFSFTEQQENFPNQLFVVLKMVSMAVPQPFWQLFRYVTPSLLWLLFAVALRAESLAQRWILPSASTCRAPCRTPDEKATVTGSPLRGRRYFCLEHP